MSAYMTPNWFFGFDVLFELAFAIISLVVSIYSFKVYRLTEQDQSKLFAYSFLFISVSYFIQSFFNFTIISKLNQNICNIVKVISVNSLSLLGDYFHILFFTLGLITLAYMTLRIKSKRAYSLLLIISISAILLSISKAYSFYFFSSLLLTYITAHYYINYAKHKQPKTLLVLFAFIFLLFGNIHFLISVNHALFYVIGHFLGLIAYFLIMINLILILKNGKKKKQA